VVLENTVVEGGQLYAGVPARFVKDVPDSLKKGEIERTATNYAFYSSWFKK